MKILRYILGFILALIAINAFGGGIYGMSGAKDLPVEWLHHSPFKTYFIPSLFLFTVVGGSCLFTAIIIFKNKTFARKASMLCSALLVIWIFSQLFIIGYVSWLQPAIFISALLVLGLSFTLPRST